MPHYQSEIPPADSKVVAALKAAVDEALAHAVTKYHEQHNQADIEAETTAAEIIASIPDKIKQFVDSKFIEPRHFYSIKLVDDWKCVGQGRREYLTKKVSAIVLAHCDAANLPYFFCSSFDAFRGQGDELRLEIRAPGDIYSRARCRR